MTETSEPGGVRAHDWDPLHSECGPDEFWSTANIGEAVPGVATPLSWSLWGHAIESSARCSFHSMGAASRREAAVPTDPSERFVRAFYGRGASQVDFLRGLADRVPGTSGAALAEQMSGPRHLICEDVRTYGGTRSSQSACRGPSAHARPPRGGRRRHRDVVGRAERTRAEPDAAAGRRAVR